MRYVSKYLNFVLLYKTSNVVPPVTDPQPKVKYRFSNGVLVIGDPASGTGSGNAIDTSDLMVLYPAETGDKQYGKDILWFEAPELDSTKQLTNGKKYKVLRGSVTHKNVPYTENQVFTAQDTSFTGNGVVALDISNFVDGTETELDLRGSWYKALNLSSAQDEASWNDGTWSTTPHPDPWTWVR